MLHIDGSPIEVIDAQVHGNQIAPSWETCPIEQAIDAAVAAMDAVGVDAIIADEYAGVDGDRVLPGHVGPNGVWRSDQPFAREAAKRHPERFAFLGRVSPKDPDLETILARSREEPNQLALRLTEPGKQVERVRSGYYDPLFDGAGRYRIPVFINVAMEPESLIPAIERYTETQFIFDHTGVEFPEQTERHVDLDQAVERVAAFSKYENVAVKWSHIERLAQDLYPFADAIGYLRSIIDAFGPQRVMWGSDCTESRNPSRSKRPCTWAEALFYLRDSDSFTTEEKSWVLGRSLRSILSWQA